MAATQNETEVIKVPRRRYLNDTVVITAVHAQTGENVEIEATGRRAGLLLDALQFCGVEIVMEQEQE